MKNLKITLILCFFTLTATAQQQQGFNYKALIKDASGNVLVNTPVRMLFNIQEELLPDNIVYSENQQVTTNENGIVILNIGYGDPDPAYDLFSDISWSFSVDYHLNVQIDINGGTNYVDMGTTQFMAVPFAKHASTATKATTATIANNVTGLEKITQYNGTQNNTGWRLVGQDPTFYGAIGSDAVDLSYNNASSSGTEGATGNYSTAMGQASTASGNWSTAMGLGTKASASFATAIGRYNKGGGDPAFWLLTDPLFEVGNGTPNDPANAFTIYKNGNISIGGGNVRMGNGNISMGNTPEIESNHLLSIGDGVGVWTPDYCNVLTIYSSPSTDLLKVSIPPERSQDPNKDIFKVKRNGNIEMGNNYISGDNQLLTIGNGGEEFLFPTPYYSNAFTVYDGTNATLSHNSGYVMIGNNEGGNLLFDTRGIMARNNGSTSPLFLQLDGGEVYVGGSIVHASDRRLKKDIETLPYGLKEILQLQPKAYNWKNREQTNKSLGLIAQEVQTIIKEVVITQDNEQKTLGISYTELIPILINAIKEQQEIITNSELRITNYESEVDGLQSTVNSLQSSASSQKEDYSALLERIVQLEKSNQIMAKKP